MIWCEEFHYWVLWFHLDLPNFGFPAVGVAKAETLQGPFEFVQVTVLILDCKRSADVINLMSGIIFEINQSINQSITR